MKYSIENINKTLSTLNFVLCFVGYQLVTSLFLPATSDIEGISRTVTIPYRAFALLIAILVIIINIKKKPLYTPFAFKLFIFYWVMLVLRIFYDLNIRSGVNLKETNQLWLYVFGICIAALLSIYKSIAYIDLNKAFNWILILSTLTLIFTLFSNQRIYIDSNLITTRPNANLALNTIEFGYLGTTVAILSLYFIIKNNTSKLKKIIGILVVVLSVFVMLRAGSRGPLVALIVTIFFFLFVRSRNFFIGVAVLGISLLLISFFIDSILEILGNISPIIESRLRMTIYDKDLSDRESFYGAAIKAFLESPIWGKQFAIFRSDGHYSYSHNIILDALMGLGIIGAGAMIFFLVASLKKAYLIIKRLDDNYWISLIFIQQLFFSMTSGALYHDQLLTALLTYLLLYKSFKIKENSISEVNSNALS